MRGGCTKIGALLAALIVSISVGAATAAERGSKAAERGLVLAFVPQENPEKLIGDIRRITEYLGKEMGLKVRGYVTQDHAAAVEALTGKNADISFMGALPFVLARAQNGAEIVLSEVYRGKPSYTAAIFVRADGPIKNIDQLRGKTIAFSDPISESGYLYPLEIFVARKLFPRGRDPQKFFRRVYFAGGYQQAIQAVSNGLVDAAGVSIYARLLLPPEKQSTVRVIAESEPIPSHAVIARKGLAPARRDAFVKAMLRLNEPARRHLLKYVYGPDGYAPPDKAAYDRVAKLAKLYGLIE